MKEEAPVTESEINKMLTEGVAMGAYEEEEPILVENIFHLADMNAGDVMTPRTQLKWIDLNGTEDEIMEVLKKCQPLPHSCRYRFLRRTKKVSLPYLTY